jgi:hypothetical protein
VTATVDGRVWTLTILAPDGRRVYSANDDHSRGGRFQVRTRRAMWKHDTWITALDANIPHLEAARLDLVVHIRNARRADPANYPSASSIKGLIDGLVAAGVVTDDRPPYLDVTMPKLRPLEGGKPRVVATIRALGGER